MLFECLVVIFLIDKSIPNNFEIIKKLTAIINENFPNLNLILVQNKREVKNSEIKVNEINEYLNLYPYIINLQLSLKSKDEVSSISNAINKIINSKTMISKTIFEIHYQKFNLKCNKNMSFILIGDHPVGKTSFLRRFNSQNLYESNGTILGLNKKKKYFRIGEDIMEIDLWDTGGLGRFRDLSKEYYQNLDGIFLLFDVTKEETFNNLNKWLKDIKQNIKNDQMPIIYIIGNKIDSDNRVISKDAAEKYVKSQRMKYFEISCKYDINNFEVLNLMLLEAYKKNNLDSFRNIMNRFNIKSDLLKNSFLLNKYYNY